MTRSKAEAAGLLFYIGEPCRYGHDGERYVSTNRCHTCIDINRGRAAARGFTKKPVSESRVRATPILPVAHCEGMAPITAAMLMARR